MICVLDTKEPAKPKTRAARERFANESTTPSRSAFEKQNRRKNFPSQSQREEETSAPTKIKACGYIRLDRPEQSTTMLLELDEKQPGEKPGVY